MNKFWTALLVVVAGIAVLASAGLLSLPVWNQNRVAMLESEHRQLMSRWGSLRDSVVLLEKQRNALLGRVRIEQVASTSLGLRHGLVPVPVLVEVQP